MKKLFTKKLISFLLIISTLVMLCVPAFADESKKPNVIDVVFLIDTSKNIERQFQSVIMSIKSQIQNLDLNGIDYRAAVVEYRDVPSRTGDSNDYSIKASSFMKGYDTITSYLDSIKLSDRNNSNSCLFSAIIDGTKRLPFRSDCIKTFFIFGTTPCYDPEPDTGYSIALVRKFYSLSSSEPNTCPYRFFTYNFGDNSFTDRYFSLLSNESGGTYHKLINSYILTNDISSNLSADFTKVINEVKIETPKPDIDDRIDQIINNAPVIMQGLLRAVLRVYAVIWKLMFGNN